MQVGIRELKANTSEIVRLVREEGEVIEITLRGEVVARIVPSQPKLPDAEKLAALWADMDALAAQVAAKWQGSNSAVDAVNEVRREW